MTKSEIILELKKQGVVAVIRGYSFEEGYQASKACIQGELKAIEVAYTNNSANEIIKQRLYKQEPYSDWCWFCTRC